MAGLSLTGPIRAPVGVYMPEMRGEVKKILNFSSIFIGLDKNFRRRETGTRAGKSVGGLRHASGQFLGLHIEETRHEARMGANGRRSGYRRFLVLIAQKIRYRR